MLVTIDDLTILDEPREVGPNSILANFTLRLAGATLYGCVLADTPKGRRVWTPQCKQRLGAPQQVIRLSAAVHDEATKKVSRKLERAGR
ncbi:MULTISPECIES: hypothetical protein [unclassified Brevundimonas]|jgi:hypothetical protein|uniref:hypothetical protein n=1 Tax=unclassified Brevundimonas TaxID=2622653 RepID=UPI000C4776D2|nr:MULTISPECIES: hypothetical protein [unclassified Brevundimonas]MAL88797.1 hypothetical protein [Brevundimonas sp.]HAJ02303.1 hypothetical protein [Brevundimonas sp.]HAV50470.1 hypothetical protein [Brevundimonas sp.]|tara:strand:- start:436 stop:702 length:267 start_codon:yes stop_codon:yes gene_type:complete